MEAIINGLTATERARLCDVCSHMKNACTCGKWYNGRRLTTTHNARTAKMVTTECQPDWGDCKKAVASAWRYCQVHGEAR